MRLLLINPNTSRHITERLAESARVALRAGDAVTGVTATGGPQVVRNAEQLREAEANALSLADDHAAGHDAIVLGISLDSAAPLLRERHPSLPIVGMTEAALLTACLRAERIGLLTLGGSLLGLYRERVGQVGVASRVVGYEAPEVPEAFGAGAQRVVPAVLEVLVDACARLRGSNAQSIVLAGAVLCGYSTPLAARLAMPVFDGVTCAVHQVRGLLAQCHGAAPCAAHQSTRSHCCP